MKWKIYYDNYIDRNDEGFFEWWAVTDGERLFKADMKEDADWLCALLNEHEHSTDVPKV